MRDRTKIKPKAQVAEAIANAGKAVKKRGTPALEPVKDTLRVKGPEHRMKVGHFYFCDACDQPIYDPRDGVIVHGNIYVADPTTRGGLIGNNFPNVKPGEKIEVTDVKETVMCRACFTEAVFNNSSECVKFTNKLRTEPDGEFVAKMTDEDGTISDEEFIRELANMHSEQDNPF